MIREHPRAVSPDDARNVPAGIPFRMSKRRLGSCSSIPVPLLRRGVGKDQVATEDGITTNIGALGGSASSPQRKPMKASSTA
jgi:hypothetical protein